MKSTFWLITVCFLICAGVIILSFRSRGCARHSQVDPEDWCQICDSQRGFYVKRTLKDNSPPIFSNRTTFFAFRGQNHSFQILAEDPENKTVNYAIKGVSDEFNISKEGVLTSTSKDVDSFKIVITATDICGEFSEKEFVFESKKCSCESENGGFCEWNDETGNDMRCVCPDGCVKDGHCYTDGETHHADWCEICDVNMGSFAKTTDNLPPVFKNNKTRFYAMVDHKNPFQLIVEDPEKKPINFSISGNKDAGIRVNESGILTIKPQDGSEVTTVVVRAIDICGAFTDQEFVFDTQVCEDDINYTYAFRCNIWAEHHVCKTRPSMMRKHCAGSCKYCDNLNDYKTL